MNSKLIGAVLVIAAITFLALTYLFKLQEDNYLHGVTAAQGGTCFVEGDCIYENRNFTLYIVGGVLGAFVLLIGIYLLFFEKKQEKGVSMAAGEPVKEVDRSQLSEEETKVYDFIKDKKGSVFQSELVRELGLSKVQATRILDGLEGTGLLERKRRGMTNLVVLK